MFLRILHSRPTYSTHARAPHRAPRSATVGLIGALLVALVVSVGFAAPAYADSTAVLDVTKSVDTPAVGPGDAFIYTIAVSCSTDDCASAQLVDPIPAEFDLLTLNTTVAITGGPAGYSWGGANNRTLTVDFKQPIASNRVGIAAGAGYTIQVGMTVPTGMSADWPANGVAVPNTATGHASNADDKSDSANVTVTIPVLVDTAVTKTWTPAVQQYSAGATSTVVLTTKNTSNAKADTLTLTEPADPTAAGNPFDDVNFAGFAAFAASDFPAGADQVQVDAYTGTAWTLGTPASSLALPASVTASDVTGLRVIFSSSTGTTLAAGGAAGTVSISLAQRAKTRAGNTSLAPGATLSNIASSTAHVPGSPVTTRTATKPFTIGPLTVKVAAGKSFSPTRIPAGGSSVAKLTATNKSNGLVATMTITEPATPGTFFDNNVAFGAFTSASTWPSGATSATVTWLVDGGPVPAPDTVTALPLPATPTLASGQHITGVVITYSGTIAQNAIAIAAARIDVDASAVTAGSADYLNDVRVDATNDAGDATPVTAPATLTVLAPDVAVTLVKTITPSAAVAAGGRSTVQLLATTANDSGYIAPKTITVLDQQGAAADDYWNAFDATAIAPTQVPSGSTLQASYLLDGTTTWIDLAPADASGGAMWFSSPLPANVIGVRFVFSNASGYSLGTAVKPALSFVARGVLRGTATATSVAGTDGVYTNDASTTAVGTATLGGVPTDYSDTATDSATGSIKTLPSGFGGLDLDKSWQTANVVSQSGQSAVARLSWGVEKSGYATATVSDTASESTPVKDTVFQAFDLTGIAAITPATDPYIAFDQVTKVELWNGTVWTPVSVCTPATPCVGQFPGYTITDPTVIASTIGVRMTFAEWTAGRTASTNPLVPPTGSGVASGPSARPLDLSFRIRNTLRDTSGPGGPWVTADRTFNAADPGMVDNTARIDGVALAGGSFTRTADDTITILDGVPTVQSTKVSSKTSLAIPNPGDTPVGSYPSTAFTLTAKNAAVSRAWYMRVTDQMPCDTADVTLCKHNSDSSTKGYTIDPYAGATYDPATNPFERFTVTKITPSLSTNSGISLANSVVTLWHFDGTRTTVAGTSATLANAAALADVVGVSVLYAGTSTTDGGTIAANAVATTKIDAQLRLNLRSDATTVVTPALVKNSEFTQLYDDVLPDTNVYDTRTATVDIVQGSIGVTASKTFTPTSVLESARASDVLVKLGATSASSTAPSREVVISDTTAGFWNRFALRSIGAVTFPAGSDRVRVDVQLDAGATWIAGTVASTAALPAGVDAAHVTGIRYTFTNAAGTNFSTVAPAPAWTAAAPLTVRLRANLLDSGTPITFPTPSATVSNTVDTSSTHDVFGTATASATSAITLDPGTFSVDVQKKPAMSTTPAGETIDWSLIVTNTGTGYLDNPVVLDQLPVDSALSAGGPLLYDETTVPTYSTSAGGILPLTGVQVEYDSTARTLRFTWPTGARLAPGEKYTIVLPLQVAPGLSSTYGPAKNTFTVSTDRTLAACTNTSGNGQGVTFSGDHLACKTSNVLTTYSASAISSFKGVKGNVDAAGVSTSGATNTTDPSVACVADSQGFYRTPCAANTIVGATDLWKLRFTNGGNIPASTATIVDVLPRAGDKFLRTGASRSSAFAPVFAGGVTQLTDSLSAGTLMTWEVTENANPCPAYESDPTCSTSGAVWKPSATYPVADFATVTAIRVKFDFTALAGGTLPPVAKLAVTYKTVNAPSTISGDGRAPVTAPVTGVRAWNTFGIYAKFTDGGERRVEPLKAGVQLASGSLSVKKVITGVSAAYAPTSYGVTVTCSVAGAAVTLPNSGKLTLDSTSTVPFTGRIDGIPVGADCAILETTASKATSVAYSPAAPGGGATITIATAGSATDAVPADQKATVTNSYGTTSLTISKAVSTATTAGSFGPYDFSLTCSVDNGTAVLPFTFAGGASTLAFTLADGDSKKVDDLPVTALCQVRETDSDGASAISASVDGGAPTALTQNQALSIATTAGPDHTAAITNRFDGGTLSVTKTLAGAGAGGFGSGPFTIAVVCTYGSQTLYDDDFSITGGAKKTLPLVFPIGTSCAVTETDAGGASSHSAPATVLIPGPTGAASVGAVTVDVTNTFTTGSLRIVKKVDGAGSTAYGTGPFEASVTCSWVKCADTLTIPLPDGGRVALTSGNGFTATITGLIAGADCSVVESKKGAATASVVSAISPAVIPAGGESVVTITNTFDTGSLVINKLRTGDGDSVARFGDGPFTVTVDCTYLKNGALEEIALGAAATQVLDSAHGYSATLTGLLVGASCLVTETDAGLAVSSSMDPADGTVTILPSSAATPATVTVTNVFTAGHLTVEKKASMPLVQGSTSYDYTLDVTNGGTVNATGVKVVDVLDATLAVTSTVAPGWTCAVTGADADGYGGTLECDLDADLGAGATAGRITYTVTVLDTIAKDAIDNTATVTSTNPIVDGDTDSRSVEVKWVDVSATSVCVKDAPWLNYTVIPHNFDPSGKTLAVAWGDKTGAPIHTDDVAIAAAGTMTGSLLWPGAKVNADGAGIAWPGWRTAAAGETATWQGLVLDPAAYGYGLRDHPKLTFSINPHSTVTVDYPVSTVACEREGQVTRAAHLLFTKKADTAWITPGKAFSYAMVTKNDGLGSAESLVLSDPVPTSLKIMGVKPGAKVADGPGWSGCAVTHRLRTGFGGTLTCTLDRALNRDETAPAVMLSAVASSGIPAGTVKNTAAVVADDPTGPIHTLSVSSSATVLTGSALAVTGVLAFPVLLVALGMLLLGLALVLAMRWINRRRPAHRG